MNEIDRPKEPVSPIGMALGDLQARVMELDCMAGSLQNVLHQIVSPSVVDDSLKEPLKTDSSCAMIGNIRAIEESADSAIRKIQLILRDIQL